MPAIVGKVDIFRPEQNLRILTGFGIGVQFIPSAYLFLLGLGERQFRQIGRVHICRQ